MDPFAVRVANLLVGNDDKVGVLEITMVGPTLTFEADMVIAICGGDLTPSIEKEPVPMWRGVFVRKGSTLTFGPIKNGTRAYLAVSGGFDLPFVMESQSTYLRAGIGGFDGRTLQAGDVLQVKSMPSYVEERAALVGEQLSESMLFTPLTPSLFSHLQPNYQSKPVIRVVRGRQYDFFDDESRETFFAKPFKVQPQSDRMGYRLSGPKLQLTKPKELISEAVTFGTIQVPADGNPIVLMADRQTTGGYPIIAQVITVDLPVMAQLNLGAEVRFEEISLEDGQMLLVEREHHLHMLKQGIKLHYRSKV